MPAPAATILRQPAEVMYADELAALQATDKHERPSGWHLSPRQVVTFICGSNGDKITFDHGGKKKTCEIIRKYHGDDRLVERCVIGLAGNRALMLVGEPGTAKSLLSELLSAAISGSSLNVVQGTAATTEDQIRYSWNYALLLAEGPTPRALVPSPIHVAMTNGSMVRFEEVTRCAPEVQDTLVSILSEKMLMIPELPEAERVLFAKPGFNVIATANLRDRGVHEMSSALKRRFNFETVHPIAALDDEVELVHREVERLLDGATAPTKVTRDIIELLVTAFQDLRTGSTTEGIVVEKPAAVMSTAEAVSTGLAAGLDAWYFGKKTLTASDIGRHLPGAVLKDSSDDVQKLRQYLAAVIARRAKDNPSAWQEFHKAASAALSRLKHKPS